MTDGISHGVRESSVIALEKADGELRFAMQQLPPAHPAHKAVVDALDDIEAGLARLEE